MNSAKYVEISAEVTPNPNTLKFNIGQTLLSSGSMNFPDREKAKGSLLPEELFKLENVIGVMVGRDFVTVTKAPAANWQTMVQGVTDTLRSLLSSGRALFPEETLTASVGATSDIEKKIRQILDSEIRPAVNMDGGDITFHGYKDGVV